MKIITVAAVCIMAIGMASPAGAIHSVYKDYSSLSTAATEACLPLHDTIRQSSSSDVAAWNQRSAGQLAALSLALGMRYALQPASGQGSAPLLNHTSAEAKAIHIIAYRQCIKEQMLHKQS